MADVDLLWDLHNLAEAHHLVDWTSSHVLRHVEGSVAEVGGGIGTYSERILARRARKLLVLEPDEICLDVLRARFEHDARVTVAPEAVPAAPTLAAHAGQLDAVVCQNVIEHIEDDGAAVDAMAAALRPGGVLSLQVPAHPRLYGQLDRVYGHHRRYTKKALRAVLEARGLEILEMRPFNLLGTLGWLANRKRANPRVGPISLRVYEALVLWWRPIEERIEPPWGLSLIVHARRA